MTLTVIFCLTLNSYICQELKMVPWDFRGITSMSDCLMGGAIGGTTFMMQNAEWTVKGYRCVADPPVVGAVENWVEAEKARVARSQSQIK